MLRTATAAVLLLAAAGSPFVVAAPPQSSAPADAPVPAQASYRISIEDVLDITVLDQAGLTKQMQVNNDGTISYPILKELVVAGMTVGQLEGRLTKEIAKYYRNPQVTVGIRQRQIRQVSVLGAVKTEGKKVMRDGWRVLDALVESGGLVLNERPEWFEITLVQDKGGKLTPLDPVKLMSADPAQNLPLVADDMIIVKQLDADRIQVQVTGAVQKPGPVPVPRSGSIIDVLNAAGGPSERAALADANIRRAGKTIPVDLRAAVKQGIVPEGITLQAGDVLTIPENKRRYTVYGAVRGPSENVYPDDETLTVTKAIVRAGGGIPEADMKNVKLIRPDEKTADGNPVVYTLNVEEMLKKGEMSKDIVLLPGDVVSVQNRRIRKPFNPFEILSFVQLGQYAGSVLGTR